LWNEYHYKAKLRTKKIHVIPITVKKIRGGQVEKIIIKITLTREYGGLLTSIRISGNDNSSNIILDFVSNLAKVVMFYTKSNKIKRKYIC